MKLWYQSTLDFTQYPNYETALNRHIRRISRPDTEVVVRGRSEKSRTEVPTTEIIGSPIVYHTVVVPEFVDSLIEAEEAGADAFIVASFSEPILPELRSLARIPVVSMPEATFLAASMCAPRIGLVTLNDLVVPFIDKSSSLHKWQERLVGVYTLNGAVNENVLERGWTEPQPHLDKLIDGCRSAIEAGAQIIVPAEGVLGVMAAENGLTDVDGIPVVDAVGTSILFGELAVDLKQRTGLAQSRAAYPAPSDAARQLVLDSVARSGGNADARI